jgi:hypothetical protein
MVLIVGWPPRAGAKPNGARRFRHHRCGQAQADPTRGREADHWARPAADQGAVMTDEPVIGGAIGHFWRGMSRKDVLELGESIDDGEAALVVVGESKLQATIEMAITKADRRMSRQIEMDSKAFEKEIEEAANAADDA